MPKPFSFSKFGVGSKKSMGSKGLSKNASKSVKKAFHAGLLGGQSMGSKVLLQASPSKPSYQSITQNFRANENAGLTAAYAATPGAMKAASEAAANKAHYQRAYGYAPGQIPSSYLKGQQALQKPFQDAKKLQKRKGLARGRVALHRRIGGARSRIAQKNDPNALPGATPAMAPSMLPAFGGGMSSRPGPSQRSAISRLVQP